MPSPDDELRALAFARVQQLRERFGGRIPGAALNEHVMLHGTSVPIWNRYKGIHKPAVLGKDGAALTVQTSAASPYADEHDPDAGHFVYKYKGTNPWDPDNIALRRAMEWQRPLIYLIAVDTGVYDAVVPAYVVGDDPGKLQFTMVADQIGAMDRIGADPMLGVRREYVTRAVMQRLHQAHFRRIVLGAYSNRCAICRLKHLPLLDAAHILPDRDARGEPVVPNGLGLCKIHHSAYDAQILGIDPNSVVHIRHDVLEEVDGPMLLHGLQELHGSKLVLPRKVEHRPNVEFLAERFDRFSAA